MKWHLVNVKTKQHVELSFEHGFASGTFEGGKYQFRLHGDEVIGHCHSDQPDALRIASKGGINPARRSLTATRDMVIFTSQETLEGV